MTPLKVSSAVALTAWFMGCAPTETGNPTRTHDTIPLRLALESSQPDAVSLGGSQGGLGVDAVWLGVLELRRAACAETPETNIPVGRAVNLLDNDAAFDLEPGSLCALELALSPGQAAPSDAPAELADATFLVSGQRPDETPFVIVSSTAVTITATLSASLDLSEGDALTFSLDVARWFENLTLDGLDVDPSGTVVVSASSNANLLVHFEEQAGDAATVHRTNEAELHATTSPADGGNDQ